MSRPPVPVNGCSGSFGRGLSGCLTCCVPPQMSSAAVFSPAAPLVRLLHAPDLLQRFLELRRGDPARWAVEELAQRGVARPHAHARVIEDHAHVRELRVPRDRAGRVAGDLQDRAVLERDDLVADQAGAVRDERAGLRAHGERGAGRVRRRALGRRALGPRATARLAAAADGVARPGRDAPGAVAGAGCDPPGAVAGSGRAPARGRARGAAGGAGAAADGARAAPGGGRGAPAGGADGAARGARGDARADAGDGGAHGLAARRAHDLGADRAGDLAAERAEDRAAERAERDRGAEALVPLLARREVGDDLAGAGGDRADHDRGDDARGEAARADRPAR